MGSSLQSTDNDFSTQGGPWQCVRAFHTNNRVASATTISLHKAVPGNACVRSTQITGSPRCRSTAEATLLFVWNARTHCQGPPCVEKSLSVDCRGDPVICVERTHA